MEALDFVQVIPWTAADGQVPAALCDLFIQSCARSLTEFP